MKIVFICGSLEPRCDGVGDYTRRLAGEIIRQGNKATIIALNDTYVVEEVDDIQNSDDVAIGVCRLPSSLPLPMRIKKAEKWIETYQPKWLSLQYVPYAYSTKGVPISLIKKLKKLGRDRYWHIMFHELWIGMDSMADLWEKTIGKMQKQIVKSMLQHLKPIAVNTQTQLYKEKLTQLGYTINYLPLFSNIAVTHKSGMTDEFISTSIGKKRIELVLFGGIHPSSHVKDFAQDVSEYCRENDVVVSLITIGRNGNELNKWITAWSSQDLTINNMGERSERIISKVLAGANFGVTTTPLALIEKSGSVAAMNAHNLPVICVASPWKAKTGRLKKLSGIMYYEKGNFDQCLLNRTIMNDKERSLPKVAKEFLQNLKYARQHGKS